MGKKDAKPHPKAQLRVFLIPCSCGHSFAVAPDYDRCGSAWGRFLACPHCDKRHDPKNRLLELGYQNQGYWTIEKC